MKQSKTSCSFKITIRCSGDNDRLSSLVFYAHFVNMFELEILPYLPEWKMTLNVRWPCTKKHACIEKVILCINFILLL